MRLILAIATLFCLFAWPGLALEKVSYDLEFEATVAPFLKMDSIVSREAKVAALLKFIDSPNTSARQKYLAWRRISSYSIYNPSILSEHDLRRLLNQKPADDDLLFQVQIIRHIPELSDAEKQMRMEVIYERALREFSNTEIPAFVADVLADFHIFRDRPLEAINILEKALKILGKEANPARRYVYNHLAILYTDVFQSDENIRKGIALYKELESQYSNRQSADGSMAFNEGIAYLFGLYEFDRAVEAFQRIHKRDLPTYSEGLVYRAAALVGMKKSGEALKLIQEFDKLGYNDRSGRMTYLNCVRELVLFETLQRDDIPSCEFVTDNYYSSAIDVVMNIDALVKRPLPPQIEFRILRNFRQYFLTKFRYRLKNSTARTTSHLELERSRIEEERSRLEAELERKSNQLKTIILYSTGIVVVILILAIWRVWWKNRRIEALQAYIRTNILQRFLPEALIKEILQGRSRLEQDPQKKMITILFADLVAFSATTEALGTDAIARLLNTYLKTMTEVVFAEGGTIDKFIGDAVMVIFGAPFESSPTDQVQRAVRCAERMFQALAELNLAWEKEFKTTLGLRIGINSGEAIVGSFGSEKRSDYTVIGNAVNIAARIEALAPPGEIVMSQTSAELYGRRNCQSLGNFRLKGVTEEQELFQVELNRQNKLQANA